MKKINPRHVMFASIACLLVGESSHAAPPEIGDVPPPYVGKTLAGNEVMLSDYVGKAVVVSFWATWCKYCLKELPILYGIQRAAGAERIHVIAINTEDRSTFVKATRVLAPLELHLTYDPREKSRKSFGVDGIPHMVIIGKDGKVDSIFRGYGESSLDGIVASINRAIGATQ